MLINYDSIQITAASEEITTAQFDQVLADNLRGAFAACWAAIRHK